MAPPAGYVDISTAIHSRSSINVIGIVVDVFGSAFRTQAGTVCITFTVKDTNLDNGHSWDGLKIKYFAKFESQLPPVKMHDVVIIQNVTIRTFNQKTMAVAYSQVVSIPWAIYREGPDASTTASPVSGPEPWEPSSLERKYALSLLSRNSQVDVTGHLRNVPVETFHHKGPQTMPQASRPNRPNYTKSSSNTNRFSFIRDINERNYVTLVCEVVKVYTNNYDKVVMDVTDYTANEGLFDLVGDDDNITGVEGDPYNYTGQLKRKRNGPSGKFTLRVTLWEAHASYAREYVFPNDFVRLHNVNVKRSRVNGTLEASLHADRFNPGKVNVTKVDADSDEHAHALMERKKRYWAERGQDLPEQEEENERPVKSKKKQKKQQQGGRQAKQESNRETGQKPLETSKPSRINSNVQASNPGVKGKSLEDILAAEAHHTSSPAGIKYRLPFQNICYRPIIRVVDFFPPNLEDFTVPQQSNNLSDSDSDSDSESYSDEEGSSEGFRTWEWRFCLLVETAANPPPGQVRERMPLFVSGPDAEYLLGIDAVDLRKNKRTLHRIKEKLFILWGDLEERKSKAATEGKVNADPASWGPVSSVPFACCIKEYGVRCSHDGDGVDNGHLGCSHEGCFGWERRFAMFQTTIHDK